MTNADEPAHRWWEVGNPLTSIDVVGVLDWIWHALILRGAGDRETGGVSFHPEGSCEGIAAGYARNGRTVEENVRNFIEWQTAKAGAIGFAIGAPGFLSVAASIPADFVSCAYLQMRAVAVIAQLCGWDPRADQVKTLAYYAMAYSAVFGGIVPASAGVATKSAKIALRSLPAKALVSINRKLGFRFATKYGTQGIVNLVDFLPLIGGAVSGAVNALLTYQAGIFAYRLLKDGPESELTIDVEPESPAPN